jgi:hypothetical protein
MQKNVTGQKIRVFAFNRTTNVPLTGDSAQITMKIAKDWGTATATNDVNPTEVEDGYYLFDMTQAETNADVIDCYPESSTGDIQVIATPATIETTPPNYTALGIESDGDITQVVLVDTTTANTDMVGTDSALLASSAPTNFGALGIESDGDITKVNLCANTTLVDTTTGVTNEVTADMTKINGVAASAVNLEQGAFALQLGAAVTGTLSTTAMTTNLTETTDDHFNGRIITWTSGVLDKQATDITDYIGSTKELIFTAVTEAPSNTDTFVIS